jgi:hypothetical protein
MDTYEILKSARERIAKPEAWLQEELAVTKDGMPCGTMHRDAARWCSVGAIFATGCSPDEGTSAKHALYLAAGTLASTLIDWNDNHKRTHADVLAAFDRAIEKVA